MNKARDVAPLTICGVWYMKNIRRIRTSLIAKENPFHASVIFLAKNIDLL